LSEHGVKKVNIAQKFSLFDDYWVPYVVGELDESYIKVDKMKGEFVWHKHDAEDEMFLVVKGRLLIKLKSKDIRLDAGEFVIIPKGVKHLPIAEDEVHVVLIEPKSTQNTGDIMNQRTLTALKRI
jgi:mannose-6-phosphate isomerase-like protein (cupin superfamily)